MSKTKILLIQIAVCIVLGTVLGVSFWWFDGGKTRERVSDCPIGVPGAQEIAFKLAKLTDTEKPVKIYQGKWHKEGFLEVIK